MKSVPERVICLIAEHTNFPASLIEDEDRLHQELGCDSLDCVEIMMKLEKEFVIDLDDKKFRELKTVVQVIDHVADVFTATRKGEQS